MAFTPRTRAQIAAEFLAYWSANYAAATPPRVLLTASGSDADLEAQVVGVELEGLEAVAAQVALDILPDQASPDSLERFSYVYDVPRRTGAASQLVIEVTGAAATTTYPIPSGTQVAASSGVLFDVIDTSVTTDAFLAAPMIVRAANPGTLCFIAAAATVTFTVVWTSNSVVTSNVAIFRSLLRANALDPVGRLGLDVVFPAAKTDGL